MACNVIATVPLEDERVVVWFDDGTSKEYEAQELGVDKRALNNAEVLSNGEGISLGRNKRFSAEELYDMGEEIDLVSDEKIRILKGLSSIRRAAGFSQTHLGEAAGIRQSVISRIEGCEISPQINTLLKLLAPLGKTLTIVDLK